MKRTLYLFALGLAVLTAIGYVIGKDWEKEDIQVKAEISFSQKFAQWTKKAKKGDPEAQYKLGEYYDTIRTDYLNAQKWYRVAATKGRHAGAQYKLGQLYLNGRGVENDLPAAMNWFRRSARQGDPRAQFFLGVAYRDGWERKADLIEGYKWFYLSNKKGDLVRAEEERFDPEEVLIELDRKMSKFNVKEAIKRANKWRAVRK